MVPLIAATAGILVEWAVIFAIAKLFAWPDMLLPILVSVGVAAASLSTWRQAQKCLISTPTQCLKALGIVPVIGAVVFCFDMLVGEIFHPMTNPVTAALNMGMFGGALTALATPFGEIVVLGGLARSVVRKAAISR